MIPVWYEESVSEGQSLLYIFCVTLNQFVISWTSWYHFWTLRQEYVELGVCVCVFISLECCVLVREKERERE